MTNHDQLCDLLRPLKVHEMPTHQVVTTCRESVPGVTNDEIVSALQQVGQEHMREAEALKLERRKRQAGAT